MDEFNFTGMFTCDSTNEGHSVFTGESNAVSLSGPVAGAFEQGKVYQISITYVGDKPPHP